MKDNIKELFEQIQSADHDVRWDAIEQLAKIKDKHVVEYLINLLENSSPQIRNSVALALKEIGDAAAVRPLIKLIQNPDNKDNRGTLVHALESLDCSECFLLMVELSLYGNFEVQSHALTILKEQRFCINKNEILKAKKMIDVYLKEDQKCKDYKILIKELNRHIDKIGNK